LIFCKILAYLNAQNGLSHEVAKHYLTGAFRANKIYGALLCQSVQGFSAVFVKNNINGIDWSIKNIYYQEKLQILA
jgi:hypothetical protein